MAILTQQDVVQTLDATQSLSAFVSRRKRGSITQVVPIFQVLTAVIVPDPTRFNVGSNVAVNQTISISTVKTVTTTVTVEQTLARTVERSKTLTQIAPIAQTLIAYIDKGVSGNSGGVFVDPAVAAFEAGLTAPTEVMFTCVNADALPNPINTHINLRKPEFGDSDTYQQYRVQRNSMGGDLQIYQDEMWPSTEKLELKFNYLDEDTASALLAFLSVTLGQKITFHDQFGKTLVGFITTPFEKILQPKVHGWMAGFTFQIWTEPNTIT